VLEHCSELDSLLEVDRALTPLGIFVAYTVVWVDHPQPYSFDGEVEELVKSLRSRYTLESLKSDPTFRAYRDFYWSIGIDPTKVRPSSEALVRRCLRGSFPRINTVVDAGNIASAYTGIPIGLYDMKRTTPPYRLTLSSGGETFNPIGGKSEVLPKGIPVLVDSAGTVMHLYPHRDSVETAIREDTSHVFVLGAGVPGVEKMKVVESVKKVVELLSAAGWSYCGRVVMKEPTSRG
jgi:DNA/RNA-binding domain of Phe-tRNA-synthetase-like protein